MQAADLHIHSDSYCDVRTRKNYDKKINAREVHGIHPQNIARALLESNLNCAGLTDHRNKHSELPRWGEVEEAMAKLQEHYAATLALANHSAHQISPHIKKTSDIQLLRGVELRLKHDDSKKGFHVGHVFEGPLDPRDLPVRERTLGLKELLEFIRAYPGITTLNHPMLTLSPEYRGDPVRSHTGKIVCELLETGVFDALEVLNGEMLTDPKIEIEKTLAAIQVGLVMQRQLARHGKILSLTGTSDAHETDSIGLCATLYPDDMDIFTAVRTGNVSPAIFNPPRWLEQKIEPLQKWVF